MNNETEIRVGAIIDRFTDDAAGLRIEAVREGLAGVCCIAMPVDDAWTITTALGTIEPI